MSLDQKIACVVRTTLVNRSKRYLTNARSAAVLFSICCLAAIAGAQVTVTAPAANASVTSPFQVTASAKSTHPITTFRIYLDNASVYSVSGSTINKSLTASTGSHFLVLQAWDSSGNVIKASRTITVTKPSSPPPDPSPTPTPAPTPRPIVLNEIQQATGWQTCGACGDSGGDGALASYSMIRGITFPTLSGSSAEFKIGGTQPFANGYWFIGHQAPTRAFKSLRYEFDLYIPAGMENLPQAIEFEIQQKLGGRVYNFAWQAVYPGNRWRVFNYTTRVWEDSGVAFQRFTAGTWHHIAADFHDDSTTHIAYHDALTIDGVRHALHITHTGTPSSSGTKFTNAFQLDLNGSAADYKVYVDNMKITYTD